MDPGENCENFKYHEPAKDKEEDRSDILSSPSFLSPASKPGPRPKLAGIDQLFHFSSWLRLASPLKRTAWLFNLSKSSFQIHHYMGEFYLIQVRLKRLKTLKQ